MRRTRNLILWTALSLFSVFPGTHAVAADMLGITQAGAVIDQLTGTYRGAIAKAVAIDTDAKPKRHVLDGVDNSPWFGTAITKQLNVKSDDTIARAQARNSLRGKKVDTGEGYNEAGGNGSYRTYAAITWKGKVVTGYNEVRDDQTKLNDIVQMVGNRLTLHVPSDSPVPPAPIAPLLPLVPSVLEDEVSITGDSSAKFRLSLAYKIVDLNDNWWPESELYVYDDLMADHGFTKLFDGAITLGDPNVDVFSGDLVNFTSEFDVNVDPTTHRGTVSYRDIGIDAVKFVTEMPFYSETQALLLAADQSAFAAGVSPIPEPNTIALMLGGLGLVSFMAARRRKQLNQ